jgi:catechol 2,3-dioxygenase-like lactoylglutathione lyase family enzyme
MAQQTEPKLKGMRHFTIAVGDLDKAELFYTQVLGGAVVQDVLATSDQRAVQLSDDVRLLLVKQDYGHNDRDQAHPHYAFTSKPEDVDRWLAHFDSWGVPYVLMTRQQSPRPQMGDPCSIELYFGDPDLNRLEIDARNYPFNEKVGFPPLDRFDTIFDHRSWPPKD